MRSIEKIQNPIKEEMLKFEGIFKASTKSKVILLNLITNYILRRKRKQIFIMFVFLTAKLNGKISNATYTSASLIELLHSATLIHDDVVDESDEKKFSISINALWHSKIAVLMGDYLLSKGLLISVDNKAYDLLEIVSEAVKEMSEGELLRIQRSRTMYVSSEQYFEILRKKSASAISACCACGATSVGSDPEAVKRMKLFGEYVGLSFHLKEDLLHFKTRRFTGSTGNNTKEKRFTLPLIFALENSNEVKKHQIKPLINLRDKNSVKAVVDFVTSKGGLEYTSELMYKYRNKAIELLTAYPESETKSSLIELIDYTIKET